MIDVLLENRVGLDSRHINLNQTSKNSASRLRTPFTSIIVPVYNNTQGLHALLRALERQTYPRSCYEVIVVNNNPEDDLAAICDEFSSVQVVTEQKEGSYHARNTGIRASEGEILAFTDSDCIPDSDWLLNGVCALCEIQGAGMIAGHIDVTYQDPMQPTACELYDNICSFRQQEFLEQGKFGVTANLFTSKTVMRVVGTFNPQLKSGGDCEWGARVFLHSFQQLYCPTAIIKHPAHRSLRSLIQKSLRVTIGTMRTLEKYNHVGRNPFQYTWHHLAQRPANLIARMNNLPIAVHLFIKFKVLGIYFFIKGLQLLERVRVHLGGKARR